MTFKFNNVYINETETIAGKKEKQGPLGNYYDRFKRDYYFEQKTWEQAEIKLLTESILDILKKSRLSKNQIDVFISGDLLNQNVVSNYTAAHFNFPYLGIYNACATSVEGLIVSSIMLENGMIKRALAATSSHNNSAEKQFRYPVEYGGPKHKSMTFTVTGAASAILSREKSNIKVESATIGRCNNSYTKDVNYMGGVMAISAAKTIYDHLSEMKRDASYYDLILTGDLGKYGKDILKDFYKVQYKEELKNLDDAACMIYDIDKQRVYSGGSGPACLPLVAYSYIIKQMKEGKIKKVLLVATGALMNTTVVNQKLEIPSIAHAISLEVIE